MTTVAALAKASPVAAKALEKAAKDFEAVFLNEMFAHMFPDSGPDSVFGGGKGEKMFKSMLVNEYANKLAQGRGVGISAQIQQAMLDMQQKANGARS